MKKSSYLAFLAADRLCGCMHVCVGRGGREETHTCAHTLTHTHTHTHTHTLDMCISSTGRDIAFSGYSQDAGLL